MSVCLPISLSSSMSVSVSCCLCHCLSLSFVGANLDISSLHLKTFLLQQPSNLLLKFSSFVRPSIHSSHTAAATSSSFAFPLPPRISFPVSTHSSSNHLHSPYVPLPPYCPQDRIMDNNLHDVTDQDDLLRRRRSKSRDAAGSCSRFILLPVTPTTLDLTLP